MMLVTIIIVNWNTKEDLLLCLKSIQLDLKRDEIEVIVVDNHSIDGSWKMVQSDFPWVKLIRQKKNEGLASGWNLAAGKARGKYLLLLNPDIQFGENCLKRLCDYMETHPLVGGVGPKLSHPDGRVFNYGAYVKLPSLLQFLCFRTPLRFFSERVNLLRRTLMGEHDPDVTQKVDQPPGAFLLLRKDLWERLDGADETFFLYYEDVDLAKRIKDAGFELWYVAEASAVHRGSGTTSLVPLEKRRLLFFTSACRYFDKHHGALKGFLVMLITQGNFLWITLRNLFQPHNFSSYRDSVSHLWRHWHYQFRKDRDSCYRVHELQFKPQELSLSIIIVNYNSLRYLRSCLKKVFDNVEEVQKEVIVVDNASTDGSVEWIKREYPSIRLIRNTENVGFAKANNQGLRAAKHPLTLLLNPDTSISENTLLSLWFRFKAYDNLGALGCRLLNSDGSLQYSCGNFPTFRRLIFDRLPVLNKYFGHLIRGSKFYSRPRLVDWVTGACVLLDREVVLKVGGFDENYFLYVEEVDLMYRLRRAGYNVVYDPSVTVTHHYEGGSPPRLHYKQKYMRRGLYLYLKKHRPFWEARLFQFLVTITSSSSSREKSRDLLPRGLGPNLDERDPSTGSG